MGGEVACGALGLAAEIEADAEGEADHRQEDEDGEGGRFVGHLIYDC
jgi:hypothetical protein